jgi:nitrogen fixation/metabolism regulation signal transduction histidine kinase
VNEKHERFRIGIFLPETVHSRMEKDLAPPTLTRSNFGECFALAPRLQLRVGMPNLPTARQSQPRAPSAKKHADDRRSLARAFRTFTQAAGSLEKSYAQLQGEVGRLRADLECANAELSRSLEETSRVRAFLGRILEGLPCGILVTDDARNPRLINPEARRLLELRRGWNPDAGSDAPAAVKELLSEIFPDCFRSEQEWSSSHLLHGKTIGVSATRVETSPCVDSETIWILRDISAQKRVAAERELARRAHALAEIATILAHEIRNPLGSMELFAGLLAAATSDMPEASGWVVHLQAGLRSLSATVNNVLQFHSQPCGELLPTSLDRLVRDTAEFLGPLARQRELAIRLVNSLDRAHVAADAHRLQQVFFNLALNAFHAMEAGGLLRIEVRPADFCAQLVQIDFKDSGKGIEPCSLDKIFEPGFTTKAGSPGLGLSVCKKVIEQHYGTIGVKGRLGQGTTFSIFLPLLKGSR